VIERDESKGTWRGDDVEDHVVDAAGAGGVNQSREADTYFIEDTLLSNVGSISWPKHVRVEGWCLCYHVAIAPYRFTLLPPETRSKPRG
jgi:hypothetical protein